MALIMSALKTLFSFSSFSGGGRKMQIAKPKPVPSVPVLAPIPKVTREDVKKAIVRVAEETPRRPAPLRIGTPVMIQCKTGLKSRCAVTGFSRSGKTVFLKCDQKNGFFRPRKRKHFGLPAEVLQGFLFS